MIPYKEIFDLVESSIQQRSKLSADEFNAQFGRYRYFPYQHLSDDAYYQLIVKIIFYSGFRAETATNKMETILSHFSNYAVVAQYDNTNVSSIMTDSSMIKNEKKIVACIKNAKKFREIIDRFGSFNDYIDSFHPEKSLENLILLKEDLQYQFEYLGGITVYHFLTEIGLPVLKPDRVITRIFLRLGLIKDKDQIFSTIIQGRRFSEATGYALRYIDLIFVKYGQVGMEKDMEIKGKLGICFEERPLCYICDIKNFCHYFDSKKG